MHSSVVEEPSPVSDSKAPMMGPASGQGPVPMSVICWYRVQSLSFSESCRSLEVKEPGRQERPSVCVLSADRRLSGLFTVISVIYVLFFFSLRIYT